MLESPWDDVAVMWLRAVVLYVVQWPEHYCKQHFEGLAQQKRNRTLLADSSVMNVRYSKGFHWSAAAWARGGFVVSLLVR